jgi:hypothetical protein
MDQLFKKIAIFFAFLATAHLLYDLVYFWIVQTTVDLHTTQESIKMIFGEDMVKPVAETLRSILGAQYERLLMKLPAVVLLYAAASIFYIIYRLVFSFGSSKRGYRYNSRY